MAYDTEKNYKARIIAAIVVAVLVVTGSILYILIDLQRSKKAETSTKVTATPEPTVSVQIETKQFEAIVASVDTADSVIVLYRLGSTEFEDFTYNGATEIRTGYNKLITASVLEPGDFVYVTANSDNLLTSIKGADNVDVYKGVMNIVIEPDLKRIRIKDAIYRYGEDLLVLNDNNFVSLETLYETDILSVYSIDNYVYLLKVTSGHGYLKLANYTDFIGGVLSIGSGTATLIEEGMRLTLSEGEYYISADTGSLFGSATIKITRDKTSVFDLAEFLPEPVKYGSIKFNISPYGAALYVDGMLKDYSQDAVSIPVGEHTIMVYLNGYNTYEGVLNVTEQSKNLSISLSAIPTATPVPEAAAYNDVSETNGATDEGEAADNGVATDSSDTANTGNSSNSSETTESSEIPLLIIHCTEGAAVFIDNVYKGVIENGSFSIAKPSGSVSLRLTCEGYITEYYTLNINDNNENAEYTLPDMTKN